MLTPLVFKVVLVLLLLFIIFNLALALIRMVKDDTTSGKPMSYYLGRRVIFSAIVVILLIIALKSGILVPNVRPY
ncbi:DUF2909 domain-containing protein [Vibrio methylphosphonaticus]|uniref:DUF2909 domain-containing protein n=1 Tax=Vibrio methylphosphonaticus TaxID=2946866 RepID=UPI00202A6F3E|nr:DUF2909 family protein [Vibrio methylphosphonaticus]MCL9773690.1 DUF2909 domain-containing protein [Vibrio methylphosphonaticus]